MVFKQREIKCSGCGKKGKSFLVNLSIIDSDTTQTSLLRNYIFAMRIVFINGLIRNVEIEE